MRSKKKDFAGWEASCKSFHGAVLSSNYQIVLYFSRIIAQILGPHTHELSGDWLSLQDLDLVVGPGRQQYASFTWSDLWAMAPWMEERITKKIEGPGLG